MPIKNAFKIVLNRFGLVWGLLLYFVITTGLLIGISLPFITPLIREIDRAGIIADFQAAYNLLMNGGGISAFFDSLASVYGSLTALLSSNKSIGTLTISFVVVVLILLFRFFNGLYEIPLANITVNWMNSNVKLSFFGRLLADGGRSIKFDLVKMLYTIVYDVFIGLIMYGLIKAIKVNLVLPFVLLLVFVVLISVRFSLTSMWAVYVVDGHGIFKAFGMSVRNSFKSFGYIYSAFIVYFIVIIALNTVIGLFTFGVGLLVTIPLSVLLCTCVNNVITFDKNSRRYYVDGNIITPTAPVVKDLSDTNTAE